MVSEILWSPDFCLFLAIREGTGDWGGGVGGGVGGFYKFFKKYLVAQETVGLNNSWPSNFLKNISWPLPSSLVPYLRLACSSISG